MNYFYIKGKGWVPVETREITMACGKRVRLEMREPNPGEFWDAGEPNTMDEWVGVWRGLRFLFAQQRGFDTYQLSRNENVITIIPL